VVSQQLRHRIEAFVSRVGEPYVPVERVSAKGSEYVAQRYLPTVVALPEKKKEEILKRLEESWRDNQDHGMIRQWGRAASGAAKFLLLPTSISELQLDPAVDVVVRLSRWHHSSGSNIWRRFIPAATFVVREAWGEVEHLYDEYSEQ